MQPIISFFPQQNRLVISGELSGDHIAVFTQRLQQQPVLDRELSIEMHEFDVLDGVATTAAVDAVRALLARCTRLVLIGAPQVLAHNLYRVGMLEQGSDLQLRDTREDEAYG